ncbi:metal ABC transporter solute-binding protein, Zn/Mn family [Halomonas sp. 328]|uniref:metal ABC transporter solute-binding protein, Zn/Mn family n=1 Tax=Halomonas sp. 328 TaxID=2776704 RepID=UPI0018A7A6D4|nr:zinc ABC transporter substrate-binding protein [Halomonas sp. 328]MBF8222799.1 zinc ABC transporter substrate-binding protein [Halomonas sp. 328]
MRATLSLIALLLGLLSPVTGQADERLRLVATTGMIGDAVTLIGGDRVAVETLMGPGVDPHLYRQTRRDILAMTRADAVFWHGLALELQLEEFLERLAAHTPVYAVGEAVPEAARLPAGDFAGQFDPHVWMDPGRWRHVVVAIRDALTELDPAGRDAFAAHTDAYLAELEALDAYAHEVLGSLPEGRRLLVTAHDAFGYLGATYDLEVVGIQGISTDSEAGLARIEALVRLLVERRVPAIFVESSVDERHVRALVEGAAARGRTVAIGGTLFSDAMGPPGSYEGSYLGMLDHNLTTIARALGGEAPPRGRLGRLTEAPP